MKFLGKVGNEPVNKWLNFGGDPRYGSEYASGYSFGHGLDPYRDTDNT